MLTSEVIRAKRVNPLLWMPTLYFAMGVPIITVSVVASIMYKNLGLSNTQISLLTGSMYLPWVIKPFWSPFIDIFKTKKFFVIFTQFVIAVSLGCVALSLPLKGYLPITVGLFWIIGFLSATHDIAADGIYINAMSSGEQAKFIGLQGVCWYAGKILSSGLLVSLTGYLHSKEKGLGFSWIYSWIIVMALMGFVMLIMAIWHRIFLPSGKSMFESDIKSQSINLKFSEFTEVFTSYFQKKDIWMMVTFILIYRLGEGFLEKIGPLFLLDSKKFGGLGLGNFEVGNINGTFGSAAFILGALIGGWIAAYFTLKRSLVLFSLMLNIPHLTFLYLSIFLPTNITLITSIVFIEKLGYGIGSVALSLYMMQQVAPGKYKTAHYAISSGLMALCMMVTGMASGVLQAAIGYKWFFIIVMFATIPSLIVSWLAPFNIDTEKERIN